MNTILWINEAEPFRLAIVLRPRGNGELQTDLEVLRAGGIDTLVSLLTPEDNDELGLTEEGPIAGQLGMRFVSYPIPDREAPADRTGYRALITDLRDQVRAGRSIGAHCRGCIGRATLLLASVMIALGWNPEEAVAKIEQARGLQVPDTAEQLEWILGFEPEP